MTLHTNYPFVINFWWSVSFVKSKKNEISALSLQLGEEKRNNCFQDILRRGLSHPYWNKLSSPSLPSLSKVKRNDMGITQTYYSKEHSCKIQKKKPRYKKNRIQKLEEKQ